MVRSGENLAPTFMHDFPQPGALPIVVNGQVIGAMGVSGADGEKCAQAAIDGVFKGQAGSAGQYGHRFLTSRMAQSSLGSSAARRRAADRRHLSAPGFGPTYFCWEQVTAALSSEGISNRRGVPTTNRLV
jgi:hypothetical protein